MADEYIRRVEAEEAIEEYCCRMCADYSQYEGGCVSHAQHCPHLSGEEILKPVESANVQPIKRGHWIEKSEEYYRLWQDSGRSWDDMPYFVTGLKFACSCCFNQYDVNAEGVEEWDFCPKCGADLRGED